MLSSGEKLSHYSVISAIGAGGMGEVYLALDNRLDRQVALKVLLAEFAANDDRVRRFEQEARAASALNHPNILTIFDIGTVDGHQYIATEFIKGETLRERMKREPLKLLEAFNVLLQVSAALGAAHEAGIIHRDIKPDNVMIRDDGLVKVLDFGLAKLSPNESVDSVNVTLHQVNTNPGMLLGTVAYMSPEQARGQKLDRRSDIFSLGIMMFEVFTGKRPFEGEGHLDLISSILKDDPAPLRELSPDLPRQLERIVSKALRKDRNHRYQDIRDLQIDLEDLRDEMTFEDRLSKSSETIAMSTPVVTTDRPHGSELRQMLTTGISTTRRFTILHALLFTVFVAAAVGTAVWYFGFGRTPPLPGSYKVTDVATWNSAPGELFSNASFSPDSKLIAFSSTKSGTKNIWVTQTGSTEAIQITNDGFSNIDPVWSPKGDEIAYFSDRGGANNLTGIWRVSALGGTPKLVGSINDIGAALRRWTATGKVYYQLDKELYAMDVSTGQSQQVTSISDPSVNWINVSPDERYLAYATGKDNSWNIMIGAISGNGMKEAAKGAGEIGSELAWLPEKNRLFYSSNSEGVEQVYFLDTSSQRTVKITAAETDNAVVDVSSDGRSIIISSGKEESNLWRVSAADGQEAPFARDLNAKLWPSVSPDNEKAAFQSIKNLSGGGTRLVTGDIVVKAMRARDDGEKPALLAENGFLPTWSPDGSAVAFMRKGAETVELYSINPNGGGEKLLTTGGISQIAYSISPYNYTQAKAFSWSPDSSEIAYISNRNGASNIWAVGLRESNDTPLTNNQDADLIMYCPIWSTDGKRIAYYFYKGGKDKGRPVHGLKVLDRSTGESNTVYESPETIRLIGWTADETGLIAAKPEKVSGLPPATVLKRIAIAGGAETMIADLKNIYFYNIFLSDDRKLIAYAARTDNKDDIWIVPSAGGAARKVTNNNDSGLYYSRLAWLHDGSSIVFGKQTRYSLLSLITGIS